MPLILIGLVSPDTHLSDLFIRTSSNKILQRSSTAISHHPFVPTQYVYCCINDAPLFPRQTSNQLVHSQPCRHHHRHHHTLRQLPMNKCHDLGRTHWLSRANPGLMPTLRQLNPSTARCSASWNNKNQRKPLTTNHRLSHHRWTTHN